MRRSEDSSENNPTSQLAPLLRHPELWQAGRLGPAPGTAASRQTVASGFAALDRHLPGGGWPASGLAELLLATAGVGELRLLAPLLAALSQQQARWIAWVAPPFVPYAPALAARGVDVHRLLLIRPQDHPQALWALERAARCGSCSLILAWLDERRLRQEDTRRLKLAARRGSTLICLFRPEQAAARPSLAELRLQLAPAGPGVVTVDVRKRRGGWPVSDISLQLDDPPGPQAVHEQLTLWRRWQQHFHDRQNPAVHNPLPHCESGHDGAAIQPGVVAPSPGVVH